MLKQKYKNSQRKYTHHFMYSTISTGSMTRFLNLGKKWYLTRVINDHMDDEISRTLSLQTKIIYVSMYVF